MLDPFIPCACFSGETFGACCGPYLLAAQPPPTAESLMRSRFSAFQLHQADYILQSWDLTTRPKQLGFEKDERRWSSLEIVKTIGGSASDERGVVEFKARYELGEETYLFHEVSRFIRSRGQWVYLDATFPFHGKIAHLGQPLKNAPCPCGSDKKYKKCCGR